LLAYAVWRSGERRDLTGWLAILGLAALQTLSSYYLGYVGFLVAAVVAGASLLTTPGQRARRLLYVASALAVAVVVMVPLSLPYLGLERSEVFASRHFPLRPWVNFVGYLFPNFARPDAGSWGPWWLLPWLALAGAVAGMLAGRLRALTAALVLLAAAGAWLGAGPSASVLGLRVGRVHDLALALVPGWSAIRVWERFGIASWLALSLLAAVPFARALRWPDRLRLARAAVALACLAGLLVASSRVEIATRPSPLKAKDPSALRWLAAHGDGDPVLEWPLGDRTRDAEAMLASTLHWLPLVNGYSGHLPASYEMISSVAGYLPQRAALETLVKLNVARWLLIRADPHRRWGRTQAAGIRFRTGRRGARVYEIPYRRGRVSPVFEREGGRSLLGTPTTRLRDDDLRAEIVPLRAEVTAPASGPLWVRLRVRNLSPVRWPAVAVDRDGLVGLTFRIRKKGQAQYRPLDLFFRLPADLEPGAGVTARVLFPWTPSPDSFEILPCLEQFGRELSRCFEEGTVSVKPRAGKDAG
jgi:hypothetical protein